VNLHSRGRARTGCGMSCVRPCSRAHRKPRSRTVRIPSWTCSIDRHIPFVFATGCDFAVPARHANVRRLEKPVPASAVCRALEAAMSTALCKD
jgi:hypothetical protein